MRIAASDCDNGNMFSMKVFSKDKIEMMDEKSSLVKNCVHASSNESVDGQVGSDATATKKHSDRGLYIIIAITASATVVLTIAMVFQAIYGQPQVLPHGAVATSFPECSQIALEMMEQGGSSVDGAVAAAFCLTVVAPHAASIAGGGVMIVHHQSQSMTTEVIDFLEAAPESSSGQDQQAQDTISQVGVPGFLRGMSEAHKKYGKLSWHKIIFPSIKLAVEGFKMSSILHEAILDSNLKPNSSLWNRFSKNGKLVEVGQMITLPNDLATLLGLLLQQGVETFYTGESSQKFIDDLKFLGSKITADDLKSYRAEIRQNLHGTYNGRKIIVPPSPTIGPILILGIKAIERLKVVGTRTAPELSNIIQVLLQLNKKAEEIRDFETYSEQSEIYSDEAVDAILNSTKNTMTKSTGSSAADDNDEHSTLHSSAFVSIVDDNDLFVSMSLNLGDPFGSKIVTSDGLILNNVLKDFYTNYETSIKSSGARPKTNVFPVVVIPDQGLCGERYAIGAQSLDTYLQFFANTVHSRMLLKDGAKSNMIRIDKTSGIVLFEAKQPNSSLLMEQLRLLGYRVEDEKEVSGLEIVSKYGDDLKCILTEPPVQGSAIQF